MAGDPEELRRRLEVDPSDEAAFAGLEALYRNGGYFPELAELYEYRASYGVTGTSSADLWVRSAEVWIDHAGDSARGETALLRGLELNPMDRDAGEKLDALLRDRGDMGTLLQVIERQIEALEAFDPGKTTAQLRAHYNQQLGEIWAHAYDRQDQAVFYFRRAFELDSNNVMALYCAREIYQQLGNYETAAKLLDLEARAEPDSARKVALYRELAHARAERLGDIEGAVVSLKRALAIEPSNADVMGELALLLLRRAPVGGGDADRMRAAELLYQVAGTAVGEAALGYCEASLDAWPEHEGAISLFEQVSRELGRLELLAERYRQLIEPLAESHLIADIYRRAGNLAIELGELDEAIGYFEGLVPLNEPGDREVLIDLYRRTGRGDELAAALATDLPSQFPGEQLAYVDPEALPRLRELAELLRAQGKDDEAEARMLEILELEPGDPEATSYLERRYRSRQDWQSLFNLLSNAGHSQKLSSAARIVRLREAAGIAEERLQDIEGAVGAYKLATILDPDNSDLPTQLERLLISGERWDDLIDRIEAAAARAETPEEKTDFLRRIADIHWGRRQDFEASSDTYRRILELKPDDKEALEALDEIYLRESDWQNLAAVLQRRESLTAIGAEKASLDLRLAAVLHEHLEDPEAAYNACQEALEHIPDRGEALKRMEAIDTISGNWRRLVETLRYRADVAEGEEAIDFLSRAAATAEKHQEDYDLAAKLWHQVTELASTDVEALIAKARCLELAGRWEEAIEGLEDVAEASSDLELRLEVRRRVARVLEEKGSREEAIEAWLAVTEEAEDLESLEALARHYEETSAHAELVEILRRLSEVVETAEGLRDVLLAEARLLAGPLEKPKEAIETLEHVIDEVDPRSREAMGQLRRIFTSQQVFDRAAEIAEREVDVTEDVAAKTELLLTCASWYRIELDDLGKAITANERVLELDPYRTDVIAALEELYVAVEDWERLLQLTRARYKASTDAEQRRQLLMAGAEICERQLDDGERAWGWYRELFDAYGHQPEVFSTVEGAAQRHGLSHELVGVYGEMAKRSATDYEQAGWWKKLGMLYAEELDDPPRALESMLRGFALDPEDRGLLDSIDEYALRAGAHDRLKRVYDALVERETGREAQIALLKRAANVFLNDQGNPSIAFDQLFKACELDPLDDALLLDLETAADASERWEALIQVYSARRELSQTEGERIDLLLRAAQVVQEHVNEPDRAFELLSEAVSIDPDDEHVATRAMQVVDGLERLSGMRTRGRYWGKLVSFYQELIERHEEEPNEQVVYLEWIARIQQDYIQDGRAAFETRKQQILIAPGHKASLTSLERLAQRLNMWSDLSIHYKDALEIVLDREAAIELHRRRARVLTDELNRPGDAIEHYWQLIQIDPHDSRIRAELTSIYEQTERWNDLMLLLEKELPLADDARQHEIHVQVATIWERQLGNTYEALDAYRRVLARWPDDTTASAAITRLQTPSRQSTDLGDEELAELGLLDDTGPPAFDDDLKESIEEELDEGDFIEEELLDEDDLIEEELDAEELIEEELDAEDLIEEELDAEELIEEELDAGELVDDDGAEVGLISSVPSGLADESAEPLQSGEPAEELEEDPRARSDLHSAVEQLAEARSSAVPGPSVIDSDRSESAEDVDLEEEIEEIDEIGSEEIELEEPKISFGKASPSFEPLAEETPPEETSPDRDESGAPDEASIPPGPPLSDEFPEQTAPDSASPIEPRRSDLLDSVHPESPSNGEYFMRRVPSSPSPLVMAVEEALDSDVEEVLDDDVEEIDESDGEMVQEIDSMDLELAEEEDNFVQEIDSMDLELAEEEDNFVQEIGSMDIELESVTDGRPPLPVAGGDAPLGRPSKPPPLPPKK